MKHIPLRDRKGVARAFALVDDEDFDALAQFPWHLTSRGYAGRATRAGRGNRVSLLMHREILGLQPGDGREGDHINWDKLDNRRANLRVCTRLENAQNHPGFGGSSRFRGVFKNGERWEAKVRLRGDLRYLGLFADELEAARAAAEFRAVHMPHITEPHPELLEAA